MKKIVLSLAAAFALTANVFAEDKVFLEVTASVADLSTTVTHKLYNAEGNMILSLTEGTSQTVYTYDELGHCTQEEFTNFSNHNQDRIHKYTYNANGQVETEEELIGERSLSTTTYTYDNHGNILTSTRSGGMVAMVISYANEYDDSDHLVKRTMSVMGRDMGTTTYDYTGDLLTKESSISGGELTGYITYAYDDNNNLTTAERFDAEDNPTSLTNYTYGEIDGYYAPATVNAVANEGNTVTITWQGTANAIVCNGEWIEVTGNTYTTAVLLDGEYTFYVVNNGNAAVSEPVDVFDNTKVGVSNVQVTGNIYGEMITITDYYGEEKEVLAYMIPISWTLPEGAQPESYRIYYNATYSVTVDDGTLRSYTIPAVNTTNYVMGQGVVTLPFQIRVVAVYATGEVEPANVVSYTLEQTEAIISAVGISDIQAAANAPAEFYSLDGVRVPASNAKHGTFIVRQGNTVRKVQVK